MGDVINLLLLGEGGVGKTTFVNSFLNYFLFPNPETAREKGVAVAAPVVVSFTHERKQHSLEIKATTTQGLRSSEDGKFREYFIQASHRQVRLIDSVGFEELTRGEETFEDVFQQLKSLKELHGVCFLIKSSISRMSNLLESYLMQTLLAFDLYDVVKNVIFIFTSSGDVSFNTGHAFSVLTGFVDTIKSKIKVSIPLKEENVFCVENKGFLHFGIEGNGVRLNQEAIRIAKNNWNASSGECLRLLSYIENLQPYKFPVTGVAQELEQFILQKAFNLCDIFAENFNNLNTCETLLKGSKEARQLIHDIRSDPPAQHEKTRNKPDDLSKKSQHKYDQGSKNIKKRPYRKSLFQPGHPQQREGMHSKGFRSLGAHPQQSKNSTSHHGSQNSLLTEDESDSAKSPSNDRNAGKNSRKDDSKEHHSTSGTMTRTQDDMQGKLVFISEIVKNQENFIQNVFQSVKEQQNDILKNFLENMAKIELFLERNGTEGDAFKNKLMSFLSNTQRSVKFENLLKEYEQVQTRVRQAGPDIKEEDLKAFMDAIENTRIKQEVINSVCDYQK
ncbi:hypothetical protein Zmor_015104 [Zophobas morio]|uniref:Uncharacterized protein n=1 Tax=Zophobas morio TaxID=2755281 RepID=A0AA38IJA0_9CUCU|nr:hypothetical protein Zmor_015104 [Zophobas morio]